MTLTHLFRTSLGFLAIPSAGNGGDMGYDVWRALRGYGTTGRATLPTQPAIGPEENAGADEHPPIETIDGEQIQSTDPHDTTESSARGPGADASLDDNRLIEIGDPGQTKPLNYDEATESDVSGPGEASRTYLHHEAPPGVVVPSSPATSFAISSPEIDPWTLAPKDQIVRPEPAHGAGESASPAHVPMSDQDLEEFRRSYYGSYAGGTTDEDEKKKTESRRNSIMRLIPRPLFYGGRVSVSREADMHTFKPANHVTEADRHGHETPVVDSESDRGSEVQAKDGSDGDHASPLVASSASSANDSSGRVSPQTQVSSQSSNPTLPPSSPKDQPSSWTFASDFDPMLKRNNDLAGEIHQLETEIDIQLDHIFSPGSIERKLRRQLWETQEALDTARSGVYEAEQMRRENAALQAQVSELSRRIDRMKEAARRRGGR